MEELNELLRGKLTKKPLASSRRGAATSNMIYSRPSKTLTMIDKCSKSPDGF